MYVKSYEEIMMNYTEYRIQKILFFYIPPLLLVIGTIGNVLSFCVLIRKSMRRLSTYNFLAVLALADTLVLYVGLMRRWVGEITGVDIRDKADWTCKLISMAGYTVSDFSVWLLIAVTIERYIVTVHSLHTTTMCTTSRAVKTVVLILVLLIIINMHFLWTTEIRIYELEDKDVLSCSSAVGHEYLVEHAWPWVDAFLYCFSPFVILCILNGFIVHKVILSRRRYPQMWRSYPNSVSTNPLPADLSESTVRLTITLLCVSFAFIICTLPLNVLMIHTANRGSEEPSLVELSRFSLAHTVSELLMYTNHSINFYLYLLTGQRFRQELIAMLCPCLKQRTSNSSYCMVTRVIRTRRTSFNQPAEEV